MRFLNYLQEEYLDRVYDAEVFINPTRKEMSSFKNSKVRFFVDLEHKNILIWTASLLHNDILTGSKEVKEVLKLGSAWARWTEREPWVFTGYGDVIGGKLDDIESDGIFYYRKFENFYRETDSKWTKTWFKKPLTETILDMIARTK